MSARADAATELLWVEVVVDQPVDDRWDLRLDKGLADRLWHKS